MSKDSLLKEYEQIKKSAGSKINDNPHNKKILRFVEIGKNRFSLGELKHELESLKNDLDKPSNVKYSKPSETYKVNPKEKTVSTVCPYKDCARSGECVIIEITKKIPKSMESCSYSLTKEQQTKKDTKVLKQKELPNKK